MSDGTQFEASVAALLRLVPGVRVLPKRLLGGKEVDVLIEQEAPFTGRSRIAVECKDNGKKLSASKVREVWNDYRTLIETHQVDQVLLVTRSGVVSSVAELLAALPMQHLTYRELSDKSFQLERLVQDALLDYEGSELSHYYEPAQCEPIDLDLALNHLELYYSDFMDYAVGRGWPAHAYTLDLEPVPQGGDRRTEFTRSKLSLARVTEEYVAAGGTFDYEAHSERLVRRIASYRLDGGQSVGLLERVIEWLDRPWSTAVPGLALLGSYGMGKSAFSRFLAAHQAQRFVDGQSTRVPLRIELRHFGSHQSVSGLISDELANRHGLQTASFEAFQALNSAGRFLIILDGFDEMKEGMSADALAYNFAEIGQLHVGQSRVLLCGRPTIFSSQREQEELLVAGRSTPDRRARYAQVELAPLPLHQTLQAMHNYASAHQAELGAAVHERLDELGAEVTKNVELQQLLARPVHFPMLVRVLPSWPGPLRNLNRATLYREFIDQILRREMVRLTRPSRFGLFERRRFAQDLAILMHSQGDARAIASSRIPDELLQPYRVGDEPLDVVRRDMVRACFLERKAPDILFFPHKSFGEYLIAERFVEVLSTSPDGVDQAGAVVTEEVLSFIHDSLSADALANAIVALEGNVMFLTTYYSWIVTRPSDTVRSAVATLGKVLGRPDADDDPFRKLSPSRRRPLLRVLTNAMEEGARHSALPPEAVSFLFAAAWNPDDTVAVHAVRAIARRSSVAGQAVLSLCLSPARRQHWEEAGWIVNGRASFHDADAAPRSDAPTEQAVARVALGVMAGALRKISDQ